MTPDYKGMAVTFIVFTVLPLVAVGGAWLIVKARARGRRLFRDLPNQRLRGMHADTRMDHRWDSI